ncbi:MAG: hypothetical protein EXR49_07135 [Dehalococcoidia bacterium]|nr:hypothetical protein [Dehalococcoidia bacterium]
MRFLMKMKMDVEKGNAAIKDPNFGHKMQELLANLKPEAAYFALEDGQRCAYLVINIQNASDMPGKVEPFLLQFNADLSLTLVMTSEDLAKAGPDIAAAVKKWG